MRVQSLRTRLIAAALASVIAVPAAAQNASQPNIVVIVADDLGYGDTGPYGQLRADTPYLDALAREGVRFTDHYAGAPVCAPSRAALITGRNTATSQIRGNFERGDFTDEGERGQMPLAKDTPTLPGLLRGAGYTTALIGKWGLGTADSEGEPSKQGFDYTYGVLDQKQAHNFYPTHLWENGARVPLNNRFFIPHPEPGETIKAADAYGKYQGNDYAPDRLIARAEQFIEAKKPGKPFFLLYTPAMPHPALQIPEPLVARYMGRWPETPLDRTDYTPHPTPRAARAAMITRLDDEVGRIRAALARTDQAGNTIILFTSDNGPTLEGGSDLAFFDATGGLRGRKRDVYEGGIRVPLIIYWPGHTKPAGISATVSANWDLLPTLAEIAGAEVPFAIDGHSMLPAIEGKAQAQTEPLYWEFHEGEQSAAAVRDGRWKAVRHQPKGFDPSQPIELYDLNTDRAETRDVAAARPDVVARLKRNLDARTTSPTKGFNFDGGKAAP